MRLINCALITFILINIMFIVTGVKVVEEKIEVVTQEQNNNIENNEINTETIVPEEKNKTEINLIFGFLTVILFYLILTKKYEDEDEEEEYNEEMIASFRQHLKLGKNQKISDKNFEECKELLNRLRMNELFSKLDIKDRKNIEDMTEQEIKELIEKTRVITDEVYSKTLTELNDGFMVELLKDYVKSKKDGSVGDGDILEEMKNKYYKEITKEK